MLRSVLAAVLSKLDSTTATRYCTIASLITQQVVASSNPASQNRHEFRLAGWCHARLFSVSCIGCLSGKGSLSNWLCSRIKFIQLRRPNISPRCCNHTTSVHSEVINGAATIFVPRTRIETVKRAFAVATPNVWNSLPDSNRLSDSISTFTCGLETYHFTSAFILPVDRAPLLSAYADFYGAIQIFNVIIIISAPRQPLDIGPGSPRYPR
jgi:hypothetical protein